MIQFECGKCHAKFSLTSDKAGHKGKCPKCGSAIEVPAAAASAEDYAMAAVSGDETLEPADADDGGEIPLGADPMQEAPPSPAPQAPPIRASSSGLVITTIDDTAVVSFETASVLDAPLIQTIGSELYVLVDEQARRKIVLNFSRVRFLSSQMLGVLIALHKKSAAIKGRVVLCGLRPDLMKVFSIMKLEKILTIVPDENSALATLGVRGGR
jgi:anti-sigma B factor antagonist